MAPELKDTPQEHIPQEQEQEQNPELRAIHEMLAILARRQQETQEQLNSLTVENRARQQETQKQLNSFIVENRADIFREVFKFVTNTVYKKDIF